MPDITPWTDTVLRLSTRIELLPVLHGSGDMAQEVRERLISRRYDCLAVPLPPSIEDPLEAAIDRLPSISVVVLPEPAAEGVASPSSPSDRSPSARSAREGEAPSGSAGGGGDVSPCDRVNFVPVDPCQPVIMGLRVARGEGIDRAYIDRDVAVYEPTALAAPDPYALKQVSCAAFAAALLPHLPTPQEGTQQWHRINWMAFRLHELELSYESILCLCPLPDWPWLRQAYQERRAYAEPERPAGRPSVHPVEAATLYFALGELPYITELYEQRRAELRSDRHLSVDGLKELLLTARTRWLAHRKDETHGRSIANWVTPHLLQLYLRYVRNLALLDRRLTPDLYTLIQAAQQFAGDEFAITVLETAKSYRYQQEVDGDVRPTVSAGIGQLELPDGIVAAKNRLQGSPMQWRSLSLRPRPARMKSRRWALQWNPYRQCSWPPEDHRIESFTQHIREQARAILGADLAKVEKFTTSVKDGIDLRETLRYWAAGYRPGQRPEASRMDLYVKEMPPGRGNVEAVVFLFETPADPQRFRWQATWYAEHAQESTLCFYATPFQERVIGPGIAQSLYGGAFFLFPPRPIPNIWEDERLGFTSTLEERLIAAAALHSREPHLVLVTPIPPLARWRRVTREFGRRLLPIPLTRFSGQTVDRLRRFHVLNGHEIRSYAAQFIRE